MPGCADRPQSGFKGSFAYMTALKVNQEFKVGLTVIIATAILLGAIIWGKGLKLEPDTYDLQVVFENVGGMVPGDPVTVNGLKAGKVKQILPRGRSVLCILRISDHIQLYRDATFTIVSAELLAGMRVEINPGRSPQKINLALQPFRGRYGGRIVDVGMTIGELAENVSGLTFRLDSTVSMINKLLRQGTLQRDLSQSLANLNQTSLRFKELLAQNAQKWNATMNNLEQGSGNFKNLVDSNRVMISQSFMHLNRISARLDTTSTTLNDILRQLNSKEGSLGKALYDSMLYIRINKTLISLDSLSRHIKREGLDINLF
ncbi:MAG TPA: MCE family protein [Caldithrix abyssi]|uniref:MCE family protein n=1 Tax=Caldithrix abyssi TaxID=187145 RepID=A0A7V1PTQ4_CALAY|nr:MCE family protein [Caldithrix abyssi]